METSTFLGMENRVLLTGKETEMTAGVIEISIQPGAGVPPHTNTREDLLWYVIDGTLTFQTDKGSTEVAEGSARFLPKGSTHTFMNGSSSPVRALLVCVPGGFEGFLLELSGKLPAGLPAGPPPAEAIEMMVRTGERYGTIIHQSENPASMRA